jgi:hypothetical protein
MSENSTSVQHVDSLSANEFSLFLDGIEVTGIFRVSGLAPFKLDVKPSLIKVQRDPIRIVRMVQRDPMLPINRWIRESIAAKEDIVRPTRQVEVVATDDGVESRRWLIRGAWISEVSYSDFDTGSGELVQESLTLQYDLVEVVWPDTALPS